MVSRTLDRIYIGETGRCLSEYKLLLLRWISSEDLHDDYSQWYCIVYWNLLKVDPKRSYTTHTVTEVMHVLINLIVLNISQCIHLIIILYTLDTYNFTCQIYFSKPGRKKYGMSDSIKFKKVTTELPKCIKNS